MTRFLAAIWLTSGLCTLASWPSLAQEDTDRCFPWQEFRNGVCVAKQTLPAPPPFPAIPDAGPAAQGAPIQAVPAPVQPNCPAGSHPEAASGNCVADAAPPLPPPAHVLTIATCDGGTVVDGRCACPAPFKLMTDDPARGGTCVRTDADNCLGGEMTVAGQCLCDGQVTMSGQVYDLEYLKGKCVPKHCPRDGPCATTEPVNRPSPKLSSDETERHHGCGRGMVATRSGCVAVRHRYHIIEPGDYLRMYRPPGYANPLQN
jgi:hypothetical protein